MIDSYKSKVYVQVDNQNRIVRCEGGYSIDNITDINEWFLIDEGYGDKFNLCQAHYYDGGLYTSDGICRYKLVDGKSVRRSDAEIEADRAERVAIISEPTADDIMLDLLADHEERICMIELNTL